MRRWHFPAAVISAVVPLTSTSRIPCPGCGGEDRAWTDQDPCGASSRQSYLYGCGQRWCYHQYHDGRCNGRSTTIIENSAKEPHVVDLANFLNSMGATSRRRYGCDPYQGRIPSAWYRVCRDPRPDRGGHIYVRGSGDQGRCNGEKCDPQASAESITAKLLEIGCEVEEADDCIRVVASKPLQHTQVKTLLIPDSLPICSRRSPWHWDCPKGPAS